MLFHAKNSSPDDSTEPQTASDSLMSLLERELFAKTIWKVIQLVRIDDWARANKRLWIKLNLFFGGTENGFHEVCH